MDFFIQLLPAFVEGLKITLFFWVVTLAGSFVLALPMVYVRLSRNAVVSSVVRFYIYIMRGTPLLLQLMFVYFGLPYLSSYTGISSELYRIFHRDFAWRYTIH